MKIEDAEKRINSLIKFGMQLGLERIEKLLNLMGNPQKKLKFIHVAGTNGKGSVCVMTSSILMQSGYKTGLFISPSITCFRERIQISNEMISEEELSNILDKIMPIVENMAQNQEFVTEFELITAVALKWFADNNCDIVVLEVGLGGRFDATNVIESPIVSVITSISLDHTALLGKNIAQIAFEKCGIIKPNGTTIVYLEQEKEAMEVILDIANSQNNKVIVPDISELSITESSISGSKFRYVENVIDLPLVGEYQIKNACVVLEIINLLRNQGFNISYSDLLLGLKNVKYPARFEVISNSPLVILDGSHNPDGAKSLAKILTKNLPNTKLLGLFGMLKDKNADSFLKMLAPLFTEIVAVEPDNHRALPSGDLCEIARKYCDDVKAMDDKKQAINYLLAKIKQGEALVISGSLYLASELRPILIKTLKSSQQ